MFHEFPREEAEAIASYIRSLEDLTDEDGFHVVNRLGGHSIKIGVGVTSARWRLRDASAVRGWLAEGVERSAAKARPRRASLGPS